VDADRIRISISYNSTAMSSETEKTRTPLPTKQMLMICVASVIEPLQFGIVFPIMYFLGIYPLSLTLGNAYINI
jgi:hypothetical protein